MNVEGIRNYCLQKNGVEESFPFDETTLVFKVGGKIFLLLSLVSNPLQFNIKCDPERAIELREEYDCVQPGYHMSKKHWNTIIYDGSVRDAIIKQWIDHSYELVFESLTRKMKEQLLP